LCTGLNGFAALQKRANLQGMVLDLEGFDSVSGERIITPNDSMGSDSQQHTSREDLESFMSKNGRIIQCRFDNARLPAEQRANCLAQD